MTRQQYPGMYPIISIVGKSDSGKTTLLEKLIGELKRRGYRVVAMKHSDKDLEPDTVNKDSWRLSQAGSEITVLSSVQKLAVFTTLSTDVSPEELSALISWDYDLLLTEGFKKNHYPKIEVHRKEQGTGLLSQPGQLLALVTDEPVDVDVPQFSQDDISRIADLIESSLLDRRGEDRIDLLINGRHIPVSRFLQNLLARTLIAMIPALRKCQELRSMRIWLRRQG